ncbi:hypothetical protein [Sphingomonas sp. 28-63-12]|uniref:hypothetical protein n=1 Tax=Sphingomonas sp. 28-63-12 TaxID=1970434 RepID=UPI0035A8ACA8
MFRMGLSATLLFSAFSLLPGAANAQQSSYKSAPGADGLPDDFHGKVSYFGNHSGEVIIERSGEARKGAGDCQRPDHRCPTRIGGSLQVDLEYDGLVVRGSFRGSGGLHDSGLIGRRQGAQCRLFDLTDGSVWSGHCDRDGFVGTVKSVPGAATQISLSVEVVGTKVNDYAERDRRRRDALLTQRRIEFLRSVIASNARIDDRLLAAVELDAYSWTYDKLRPETLTIVRHGKARSGRYQIDVEFDLVAGGRGWAHAQIDRDSVACIEFWDVPGQCRAINQPPALIDPDPYVDDTPLSSFTMPKWLPIPREGHGA